MAKKKSIDEAFWESKQQDLAMEKYTDYLRRHGEENSPHSAHMFAIGATGEGGGTFMKMTERQLIIFLAGSLPPEYD